MNVIDQSVHITLCGNTAWNSNPLGAKPLAIELSKYGNVLYVEPPISHLTAKNKPELEDALKGDRIKEISPTLKVLTPAVLPFKDRPVMNKITSALLNRQIKSALKNVGVETKKIGITTAPHYQVSKNLFDSLIYWMMDDYVSQPSLIGVDKGLVTAGLKYALKSSDSVVVVSEYLKGSLDSIEIESNVINNGADSNKFRYHTVNFSELEVSELPTLPDVAFALYVGGINNRVDLDFLFSCAKDGIELVIAGGKTNKDNELKFDELVNFDNVTYLGNINHDLIPDLMSLGKVGLVPYSDTEFNRASFPLKITEYLLCGMSVASTDLNFVDEFKDNVYSAKTPEEFSKLVESLLNEDVTPGQRTMKSTEMSKKWSLTTQAESFIKLISS